ncbi:MAG: alkaline phosphatase [Lentisphaeria bacterium]|nr:alkaline phosphatase [Lentisphaeria bacterium]
MKMKKLFTLFLFLFAVLVFAGDAKPKYVFLFIGDGMSTPQRMIADEFSRKLGRGQLVINTLPMHATTRTCSANSLVTDSAAAATAIACGERTNNGRIGMNADGSKKLVSLAEVARDSGKKIGIVTSVTINHATPAGFYAHRRSRSEYYAIGLDLIASKFDYFGGGGVNKHDDKTAPEYQGDIYDLAAKAGYKVVGTRDELLALKPGCGKVLAYGVKSSILPFAIDRKEKDTVATLAEFTAKGIELLQDGPNGFFMMVEGGAIDYAGHANDAATNLHEVIAFDMAVEVAVAFAKKHPDETLIVVTGDHETGGMTMGFAGTGYALYVDRLINQTCSGVAFMTKIAEMKKDDPKLSFGQVRELLTKSFGFKFSGNAKKDPMVLTEKEAESLEKAFEDIPEFKPGKSAEKKFKEKVLAFGLEAKRIISSKAGVGWTSGAHTALPVLTTSMGPKSELFTGFINNTDISIKMKSIF